MYKLLIFILLTGTLNQSPIPGHTDTGNLTYIVLNGSHTSLVCLNKFSKTCFPIAITFLSFFHCALLLIIDVLLLTAFHLISGFTVRVHIPPFLNISDWTFYHQKLKFGFTGRRMSLFSANNKQERWQLSLLLFTHSLYSLSWHLWSRLLSEGWAVRKSNTTWPDGLLDFSSITHCNIHFQTCPYFLWQLVKD